MKLNLFFFCFVMLFGIFNKPIYAQLSLPYMEDFTGDNDKGLIGPSSNSYIDTDGKWSVTVVDNQMSDEKDYIKVVSEKMEIRDVNTEVVFNILNLDVSAVPAVNFSVELSQVGGLESSDFIRIEYSIDGSGSFAEIATRNESFDTEVISKNIDVSSASTISFRIIGSTSADGEKIRFDNIAIIETTIPAASISFKAQPKCQSLDVANTANTDSMYVVLSDFTSVVGTVTFTTDKGVIASGNQYSTGTNHEILITGLSKTDYGKTFKITATQPDGVKKVEIPVLPCGYNLNDNYLCASQNEVSVPAALVFAQPNTDLIAGNTINYLYVYVLLDTDNKVLNFNESGLFESLMAGNSYKIRAYCVEKSNSSNFKAQLTIGSEISSDLSSTAGCFGVSSSDVLITPECCLANAGSITNTTVNACQGSSNLNITVSLNEEHSNPMGYSYRYILTDNEDKIEMVVESASLDFTTYTVEQSTTYKLYGFQYRDNELIMSKIIIDGTAITSFSTLTGKNIAQLNDAINPDYDKNEFCGAITTSPLLITINPIPITVSHAASQCEGQSNTVNFLLSTFDATISSGNAVTYYASEAEANGTASVVTPLTNKEISTSDGSVILYTRSTNSSTCFSTGTLTLSVDRKPMVSIVIANSIVCTDGTETSDQIPINGTIANTESVQWTSSNGGTSFSDGTNINTTYTINDTDKSFGSVLLKVTAIGQNTCSSENVTVEETITINYVKCGTFPWSGN